MKIVKSFGWRRLAPAAFLLFVLTGHKGWAAESCPDHLDHEFRRLHSSDTVNLCRDFGGRPMLIVNTASHCGFTPQFKGIEALHRRYAESGLVVIGFPSDDFHQAADSEREAAQICYVNYGVTFTMLSTVSVKGEQAHPLFKELARQSKAPTWNFNKYVVDRSGTVSEYFNSGVTPDSEILKDSIEKVL